MGRIPSEFPAKKDEYNEISNRIYQWNTNHTQNQNNLDE